MPAQMTAVRTHAAIEDDTRQGATLYSRLAQSPLEMRYAYAWRRAAAHMYYFYFRDHARGQYGHSG